MEEMILHVSGGVVAVLPLALTFRIRSRCLPVKQHNGQRNSSEGLIARFRLY